MTAINVVLATDLSGDDETGLALASRAAAERGATLIILHVVAMTSREGEGLIYRGVGDSLRPAKRRLTDMRPPDPSVRYVHVLEVGDPESVIADFAEREGVELLVMEVRRRSLLRRALGRSLVERLVGRVSCSVMTYRARDPEPEAPSPRTAIESEEQLVTLLNARVEALVAWTHARRELVLDLARSRSVRDAIASLSRGGACSLDRHLLERVRRMLELELAEHQRALPALGVEVVHREQTLLCKGVRPKAGPAYAGFLERLQREEASVSLPLEADSGASCVIVAAARVPLPGDEQARLSFTLDARRDFLRILDSPGHDPTAETYAFDASGVMLSNSRFANQLRRVGLLPLDPRVQTPRRLRICDPGGNLLEGWVRAEPCPLTRMALDATSGHDGSDWRGYRDYRGVEVVGAWRWVSDLGFGVAAEVDQSAW